MGLGNFAKHFAGGPIFSQANFAGSKYADLTRGPEIKIDEIDPGYKKAVSEQTAAANKFRSELPSYKRDMFNAQADPTRAGLAGQIAGQRSNLSSRGLLYGGLRQGKEAGVHAGLAGQLGGFQQGANARGFEEAQNYDLGAIQNAQALRAMEQERNQAEYDLKKQQADANKGLLSALGGGVGGIVGGIFGGK